MKSPENLSELLKDSLGLLGSARLLVTPFYDRYLLETVNERGDGRLVLLRMNRPPHVPAKHAVRPVQGVRQIPIVKRDPLVVGGAGRKAPQKHTTRGSLFTIGICLTHRIEVPRRKRLLLTPPTAS